MIQTICLTLFVWEIKKGKRFLVLRCVNQSKKLKIFVGSSLFLLSKVRPSKSVFLFYYLRLDPQIVPVEEQKNNNEI